jgi:uncharacterized protein YkwD
MKKSSSITLALALIFLMPTWVKAACNSVYTLPVDEWHLISLPCDPGDNNSVADIFGDDIDGQLTVDWAVFKFNAQTQSYDSLSNTDTLEQGQGYWITTISASAELDLPDTSTETPVSYPSQCSSGNGCFDIPLQSSPNNVQWNLLGFPFTSNQAWNTSKIVTNDSCQSTACSISEASSDDKNILNQQVFKYVEGEGYVAIDNATELTPWSGFWAATLENAYTEGQPRLLISSPIDNSDNGHLIPAISGADRQKFLSLINNARSQGRTCGSYGYLPAVPAVTWSDKLYKAAYEHSQDLAVSHTFSHSGSGTESDWSGFALNKQSNVADRLANYNYSWNSYGENIAAGQTTAEIAMNGWLGSPGHCNNIMSRSVTQVGMAKKTNLDAFYRHYWTQNFGRSR